KKPETADRTEKRTALFQRTPATSNHGLGQRRRNSVPIIRMPIPAPTAKRRKETGANPISLTGRFSKTIQARKEAPMKAASWGKMDQHWICSAGNKGMRGRARRIVPATARPRGTDRWQSNYSH